VRRRCQWAAPAGPALVASEQSKFKSAQVRDAVSLPLPATGNRPALTRTEEWYWHVPVHPSPGRFHDLNFEAGPGVAVGDTGFEQRWQFGNAGTDTCATCLRNGTRHECENCGRRDRRPTGMTPRHCRRTQLYGRIGLCRPSELKFSNLPAVQCSSTPLDSSAAPSITARATVRPELQSEGHCRQRMHVIREGKTIPVGLADVGSLPPLLTRHVRPRYCAVQ